MRRKRKEKGKGKREKGKGRENEKDSEVYIHQLYCWKLQGFSREGIFSPQVALVMMVDYEHSGVENRK